MSSIDCIFCKIANGEIPSSTVYEDQLFRVIMDISPASYGHAILIPKKHVSNLYELPIEEASQLGIVLKKVACAMERALKCDGLNILQNNGETAGQTVFHFHVHLIPRYKEDDVTISWPHKESYDCNFGELAQEIKNYI